MTPTRSFVVPRNRLGQFISHTRQESEVALTPRGFVPLGLESDPETLWRLASDLDDRVREMVAAHPSADDALLLQLAKDPVSAVASAAILSRRCGVQERTDSYRCWLSVLDLIARTQPASR